MPASSVFAIVPRDLGLFGINGTIERFGRALRFPRLPELPNPLRNLDRVLRIFGELEKPRVSELTTPEIASAIRSERIPVRADRELTDGELDRLADRIAAKFQKPRRRRPNAIDIEVEDAAAHEIGDQHVLPMQQQSAGRALGALPTGRFLRAQHLLRDVGLGKYSSTKTAHLVEEMLRATEDGSLCASFPLEKSRLRGWLKVERERIKGVRTDAKRKNKGQVPSASTVDKVINSLEPIYQILLRERGSKLALNSEVPARISN